MSSVCGVSCPLTTPSEKFIDFNEFKNHGIDLLSLVHSRKWEEYFNMLERPIYLVLIREFWKNVSLLQLRQGGSCIKSNVFGIPIILTPALIAKAILCDEIGIHIRMYPLTSPFLKAIPAKILATKNNLISVSSLLPTMKI